MIDNGIDVCGGLEKALEVGGVGLAAVESELEHGRDWLYAGGRTFSVFCEER